MTDPLQSESASSSKDHFLKTSTHSQTTGSQFVPILSCGGQRVLAAGVMSCLVFILIWYVWHGGPSSMVDYDDALFQPAAYTVNVNVAEWPELAQLPGVGPSLARRIVEFRVEHGAFDSPQQLLDVPGVGDITLRGMLPYIRNFSSDETMTTQAEAIAP